MSTYPNLPGLPIIDLTGHYLAYLDGIDAENQLRHLHGVPLVSYPTFDEFVGFCGDASFDALPALELREFVEFALTDELDNSDDSDLKWFLPLPLAGIEIEDEENALFFMPDDEPWVTDHGSYAFISSSKH